MGVRIQCFICPVDKDIIAPLDKVSQVNATQYNQEQVAPNKPVEPSDHGVIFWYV